MILERYPITNRENHEKRRDSDPILSEAYTGDAGDAEDPARPEAESEEAGPEPFEGERAVEASLPAPPEESAGARAENAIAQADSILEPGPPDRAGEAPFVDAGHRFPRSDVRSLPLGS